MTHKYEIDRRYEFTATADSVSPVPDGTSGWIWTGNQIWTGNRPYFTNNISTADWRSGPCEITHFMVTEYPPEKQTCWVNIYSNDMGERYNTNETRAQADKRASSLNHRSACIKIEWTEGEGL